MADSASAVELRAKAIAAAEAIFRITDLPSFDPALRFALRRQATEILGSVTGIALFTEVRRTAERERISALVAAIQELLRFVVSLRLVTRENAERIAAAYARVRECLSVVTVEGTESAEPVLAGRTSGEPPESVESPGSILPDGDLNERQEKIVAYLASTGRAQLGDIHQLFGDVCSEKTIQRDLWQLVSAGRIKRQGDNRWTVYSLI